MEEAPGDEVPAPVADRPPLPTSGLVATLCLLALEAGAAAYFVIQLLSADELAGYVASNRLPPALRDRWLVAVATPAVIAFCLGVVAARTRRWRGKLSAGSRALSPIFVLALMPSMLDDRAWQNRDMPFLLSGTALTLAAAKLISISAAALDELGPMNSLAVTRFFRMFGASRKPVRGLVCLAAFGLAAYFAVYTIRLHHKLETSVLDLGLFDNLFWNAMHGRPFYAPSANGPGLSYLAVHAEFLLYLLLPFYALVPRAETLLCIQAVIVATSAIPLYFIAERRLGPLPAAVVSLGLLLYPPLHQPVFYDFHFLTLAPCFILWAALCLERRAWVGFWIFVLLSFMCREDVALGLFWIGAGLALSPYQPRVGLALGLSSAAYFLAVKFVVMHRFGGESFVWLYSGLLPHGDHTFSGVLKTLLLNPLYTLGTILVPEKISYVLQILLPVAFVPLRKARLWFLLFPGIFITLLTTGRLPIIQTRFQYVAHFIPYVFLGVVAYLASLRDRRKVRAVLVLLSFTTILTTAQFGAFQQRHFFAGFKKIDFDWTTDDIERLSVFREVIERIPPAASVSASEPEGAHLGNRTVLVALKDQISDTEYILFSVRHLGFGRERELLRGALVAGNYGWFAERGEFIVLRRGAPATDNPRILARL